MEPVWPSLEFLVRAAAWGQTIVIELIYAGPTPAVREGTITESHDPPMAGIIVAAL
jgi:hypothetical protein